jgi:5-formyltetrahydrofolate cyclo-ligase
MTAQAGGASSLPHTLRSHEASRIAPLRSFRNTNRMCHLGTSCCSLAMTSTRDEIRRAVRARRRQIPADERARASRCFAIAAERAYLLLPQRRIAIYHAYGHEADAREIAERAWQRGCIVYLPVIAHRRSFQMEFRRFDATTPLRLNSFGILEPAKERSERIPVLHLDVIFMPLVAFDDQGSRLGSGAGFYDRALSHLHAARRWRRPKLVGVAYAQQRVASLDANKWDIPMDAIITQSYFKRFNPFNSGSTP